MKFQLVRLSAILIILAVMVAFLPFQEKSERSPITSVNTLQIIQKSYSTHTISLAGETVTDILNTTKTCYEGVISQPLVLYDLIDFIEIPDVKKGDHVRVFIKANGIFRAELRYPSGLKVFRLNVQSPNYILDESFTVTDEKQVGTYKLILRFKRYYAGDPEIGLNTKIIVTSSFLTSEVSTNTIVSEKVKLVSQTQETLFTTTRYSTRHYRQHFEWGGPAGLILLIIAILLLIRARTWTAS